MTSYSSPPRLRPFAACHSQMSPQLAFLLCTLSPETFAVDSNMICCSDLQHDLKLDRHWTTRQNESCKIVRQHGQCLCPTKVFLVPSIMTQCHSRVSVFFCMTLPGMWRFTNPAPRCDTFQPHDKSSWWFNNSVIIYPDLAPA